MSQPERWQLLANSPVVPESVWLEHASKFVTAFVVPEKRERWAEVLSNRPRRLTRDSHKLHSALDRRTCYCVGEVAPDLQGEGVFYGFCDVPQLVPATLAAVAAGNCDALFSLIPGELALYFFHEGEVWLCGKKG